jgi:hypothetical protein
MNQLLKHNISSPINPYKVRNELTQKSITASFKEKNNSRCLQTIAKTFASLSLPYSLIETKEFRNMLEEFRGSSIEIPSSYLLVQKQKEIAHEMESRIIEKVTQNDSPISLAIDSWTNCRHSKVINLLLFHEGVPFFWDTIENIFERTNSSYMFKVLSPTIEYLLKMKVKIISVVMDNASTNIRFFELLKKEIPFLINIPCSAHLLQLCVNKILKLPSVKSIIDTMIHILDTFKSNNNYLLELRNLQASKFQTEDIKALIRPTDTRWSSSVAAARRLYLLRSYIKFILTDIPENTWDHLKELMNFLEPFEIATNILQTDSSTIYYFYKQYRVLLTFVREYNQKYLEFDKVEIHNILVSYWKKYIDTNLIIVSAMLSFDESYNTIFSGIEIIKAKDWFTDFAVQYLEFYYPDTLNVKKVILHQFSSFQGKTNEFSNLSYIVSKYKDEDKEQFDAKRIWYYYLSISKEFCNVVIALLSMPISEAAVERSFSLQSVVHRKLRNRLSKYNIRKEMLIAFNERSFSRNKYDERKSVEEILVANPVDDIDLFEYKANQSDPDPGLEFVSEDYTEASVPPSTSESLEYVSTASTTPLSSENFSSPLTYPSRNTKKKRDFLIFENVTNEFNEMHDFIVSYIESKNITRSTRWNDQQFLNLEYALSTWKFSQPVKDTTEIIKNKIVQELKRKDLAVKRAKTMKMSGDKPNFIDLAEETRICCVCTEIMTEDSWHNCHTCKLPMHGSVVCKKRELIVVDESDNLICNNCNV